jgi:hypothetical protein
MRDQLEQTGTDAGELMAVRASVGGNLEDKNEKPSARGDLVNTNGTGVKVANGIRLQSDMVRRCSGCAFIDHHDPAERFFSNGWLQDLAAKKVGLGEFVDYSEKQHDASNTANNVWQDHLTDDAKSYLTADADQTEASYSSSRQKNAGRLQPLMTTAMNGPSGQWVTQFLLSAMQGKPMYGEERLGNLKRIQTTPGLIKYTHYAGTYGGAAACAKGIFGLSSYDVSDADAAKLRAMKMMASAAIAPDATIKLDTPDLNKTKPYLLMEEKETTTNKLVIEVWTQVQDTIAQFVANALNPVKFKSYNEEPTMFLGVISEATAVEEYDHTTLDGSEKRYKRTLTVTLDATVSVELDDVGGSSVKTLVGGVGIENVRIDTIAGLEIELASGGFAEIQGLDSAIETSVVSCQQPLAAYEITGRDSFISGGFGTGSDDNYAPTTGNVILRYVLGSFMKTTAKSYACNPLSKFKWYSMTIPASKFGDNAAWASDAREIDYELLRRLHFIRNGVTFRIRRGDDDADQATKFNAWAGGAAFTGADMELEVVSIRKLHLYSRRRLRNMDNQTTAIRRWLCWCHLGLRRGRNCRRSGIEDSG